jgi:hypothetical protein
MAQPMGTVGDEFYLSISGRKDGTKGRAKQRQGRCYRGECLMIRCDHERTTCAADAFVVSDQSCPVVERARNVLLTILLCGFEHAA